MRNRTLIDAQRAAHNRYLFALAAHIRVHKLDGEGEGDEVQRAVAQALLAECTDADLERALALAAEIKAAASPDCPTCQGVGAYVEVKPIATTAAVDGESAPAAAPPAICACARDNARKRRRAERDAQPAFVSTRPGDAPTRDARQRRIGQAERAIAEARAEETKACAATDAKLALVNEQLAELRAACVQQDEVVQRHADAEAALFERGENLRLRTVAEIARLEQDIAQCRANADAEAAPLLVAYDEASTARAEAASVLDERRRALLALESKADAVASERARIAARFTTRITREEKRLRRLRFLIGDPPDPSAQRCNCDGGDNCSHDGPCDDRIAVGVNNNYCERCLANLRDAAARS